MIRTMTTMNLYQSRRTVRPDFILRNHQTTNLDALWQNHRNTRRITRCRQSQSLYSALTCATTTTCQTTRNECDPVVPVFGFTDTIIAHSIRSTGNRVTIPQLSWTSRPCRNSASTITWTIPWAFYTKNRSSRRKRIIRQTLSLHRQRDCTQLRPFDGVTSTHCAANAMLSNVCAIACDTYVNKKIIVVI